MRAGREKGAKCVDREGRGCSARGCVTLRGGPGVEVWSGRYVRVPDGTSCSVLWCALFSVGRVKAMGKG